MPNLPSLDLGATDVTTEGRRKLLPKLSHLRVPGAFGDLLSRELASHLTEHTAISDLNIYLPMEGDGWVEAIDWIGAALFREMQV